MVGCWGILFLNFIQRTEVALCKPNGNHSYKHIGNAGFKTAMQTRGTWMVTSQRLIKRGGGGYWHESNLRSFFSARWRFCSIHFRQLLYNWSVSASSVFTHLLHKQHRWIPGSISTPGKSQCGTPLYRKVWPRSCSWTINTKSKAVTHMGTHTRACAHTHITFLKENERKSPLSGKVRYYREVFSLCIRTVSIKW